jgi:hypothetical protein
MKEQFLRLIGGIPQDETNEFRHRHSVHQGWWRTAVLLEEPGRHPESEGRQMCSMIDAAEPAQRKNFLTSEAYEAAEDTIGARGGRGAGTKTEYRLWGDLLSSQAMCFNFWAPLKLGDGFTEVFLGAVIPDLWELIDIHFQWAPVPKEAYTGDDLTFDVMIEYRDGNGERVLWGLKCNYADSLISQEHNRETYRRIFEESRDIFLNDYRFYTHPSFNQLFRNQLLACAYERRHGVRCYCGLFCSGSDERALDAARRYQAALTRGSRSFSILTHQDFIETAQRLRCDWRTRKWTMLLWARYLGLELSEEAYQAHCEG